MLVAAYATKEAFHDLYDYLSRARAWKDLIPTELDGTFREARNALDNWWTEIFNWYEYRISNGYTESINRLAKEMDRIGGGYSFDVIRARLVYDEMARKPMCKVVRPKPWQQTWELTMGRMTPDIMTYSQEKGIEYGPHIPTLFDLLESGPSPENPQPRLRTPTGYR